MSIVLYRKYRSKDFDQLVGQDHISSILKRAVSQSQVGHAYLFYGPRGLGKTSTARILAKSVNCLKPGKDGNPCGKCEVCKSFEAGKFLDLIEIDAASNRGIDQIRELKEKIEFSPSEGKYKVYVVDEVHMLTKEAFNALLKTPEEPPTHAMFILCTTEVHKVPATILSRCQRFDFRLGTRDDIEGLLKSVTKKEKVKLDSGALSLLIENAKGSYRDALSLLDVVVSGQKDSKKPKEITEEEVRFVLGLPDSTMAYFFLEKIVSGDQTKALELVEELSQKGVNLEQFIKFCLSVLQKILVDKMKGGTETSEEYSFSIGVTREKTLKLINMFINSERSLKDTVIPTLPLEILVADSIEIFGSEGSSDSVEPSIPHDVDEDDTSPKTKVKKVKKEKGLTIRNKELGKKWRDVLKELKPFNSHLYAFVGRSKVISLENGVLTLAVAFDFHKERIECPKSKTAISAVFQKVFGEPVKLECVVDANEKGKIPTSDTVGINEMGGISSGIEIISSTNPQVIDSVTEVFGDELVNI
ncbi:MAG: DNA polymerase III subunit gamma/tau [bacterium]